MRGKELLTEDQRTEFVRIPADMSESELETYYTFSQYDLEIIKRHRRDHNRLREMGRIEKTIFILDYISNETLRRKIQRGLNKGEAMNGLARALFFGKRGELRERGIQDQLQRASALNILINAISVWNTVYLTEATKILKEKGNLREDLLKHVSPLGWEHINFLGEYNFDTSKVASLNSLRPLIQ